MSTMMEKLQGGPEWLRAWDPENDETWNSKLAWQTLWITTFSLTMCFVTWFLPSAIVPKLNAIGYSFTKEQLYWLAAVPGLSGGLMRLLWMVLPPIMGTRKMVAATTLLLFFPVLGWGVRSMSPTAPYWELLTLAFLAGIGGGLRHGLNGSRFRNFFADGNFLLRRFGRSYSLLYNRSRFFFLHGNRNNFLFRSSYRLGNKPEGFLKVSSFTQGSPVIQCDLE